MTDAERYEGTIYLSLGLINSRNSSQNEILRYTGRMARPKKPRSPQLELAGELCIAFVNTAGARDANRQLGVGDYADLLAWGQQAGTVSVSEVEGLRARAAERPQEAEAVYARAVGLRSALARAFLAIGADRVIAVADLDIVNGELAGAMASTRLVPGDPGITWGWGGDPQALDRVHWPVVHSAWMLLTSLRGESRVRQCAAGECKLFFVDRKRGNQRRWCDWKVCGHRTHARRYYNDRVKPHRVRNPWPGGYS